MKYSLATSAGVRTLRCGTSCEDMADLKEATGEAGFRFEEVRRNCVREGVTALEAWRLDVERLDCKVGVVCLSLYEEAEDGDLVGL